MLFEKICSFNLYLNEHKYYTSSIIINKFVWRVQRVAIEKAIVIFIFLWVLVDVYVEANLIGSIKNPFVCFQWWWYNSTQLKIPGITTQSIVICIIFRPISSHTEIHFRQTIFIILFFLSFSVIVDIIELETFTNIMLMIKWFGWNYWIGISIFTNCACISGSNIHKDPITPFSPNCHYTLKTYSNRNDILMIAGWLRGLEGGEGKQIFFFRLIVFYCNRKRCWDLKRQHSAEMNVTIEK